MTWLLALLLCAPTAGAQRLAPVSAPIYEGASAPATKAVPPANKVRAKQLKKKIDPILASETIARGFWGIAIEDATTGATLYELNADRLFSPASNTKLFTTVAALALLGPEYKFRTTVESAAAIDSSGRLTGDLLLVGRGDPNLSNRVLPYANRSEFRGDLLAPLIDLADQVQRAGIKQIDGDVVGDDSYFAFQRFASGWAQDDLMWPDGAPASALTLLDNTLSLRIQPGDTPGAEARISVNPDVPYYIFQNHIVTTPAGSAPRELGADRQPGSMVVDLWGSIPQNDSGTTLDLAIEDPADYAARIFKGLLEQRGIQVIGKNRAQHTLTSALPLTALKVEENALRKGGDSEPPAPPRKILALHESAPLALDVTVVNKISHNLHAELLLRTAGRERGTAPTLEGALAAEKSALGQAGLMPEEYSLNDGSGMSLQNLATPHSITKLLRYAATAPWAEIFRNSLPVAGVDGSLVERFRGTPAAGRVFAKTGTLTHVNALSGYAETVLGQKLVFSIMGNNHKLNNAGGKRVIDAIVLAMVDDSPPLPKKKKKSQRAKR